jgi:hypothetical protein
MNFRHIETPFFILLHHKRHYSGDAIFAHSIGVFHFAILLQYPFGVFVVSKCLYLYCNLQDQQTNQYISKNDENFKTKIGHDGTCAVLFNSECA